MGDTLTNAQLNAYTVHLNTIKSKNRTKFHEELKEIINQVIKSEIESIDPEKEVPLPTTTESLRKLFRENLKNVARLFTRYDLALPTIEQFNKKLIKLVNQRGGATAENVEDNVDDDDDDIVESAPAPSGFLFSLRRILALAATAVLGAYAEPTLSRSPALRGSTALTVPKAEFSVVQPSVLGLPSSNNSVTGSVLTSENSTVSYRNYLDQTFPRPNATNHSLNWLENLAWQGVGAAAVAGITGTLAQHSKNTKKSVENVTAPKIVKIHVEGQEAPLEYVIGDENEDPLEALNRLSQERHYGGSRRLKKNHRNRKTHKKSKNPRKINKRSRKH
jgi:hypothetical protein